MTFIQKHYTADTHFGHEGMLTFGGRPFASVEEMDRQMISNWNSTVKVSDIVYHLGDFSMGLGDADRVRRIFAQLNGKKHLIIGNHDVRSDGSLHPTLASLEWASQPTHLLEVKDCGQRVILSHWSMRVWNACHHGSWHLFGHSHGRLPPLGRSRDVGVDCADTAFTPRTFQQLTAGMIIDEVAA